MAMALALDPHPAPRPRARPTRRRFVGLMKVLLPALAVTLFAVVVLWPQFMNSDLGVPAALRGVGGQANNLEMIAPRYFGVDQRDRPYRVVAERARQEQAGAATIELNAPRAELAQEGGRTVSVDADTGVYDQKRQVVELIGDVDLSDSRGYVFRTERAHIDLAAGVAEGDLPVSGTGPLGNVQAQGFRVSDDGKLVSLHGRSRLVINSRSGEAK